MNIFNASITITRFIKIPPIFYNIAWSGGIVKNKKFKAWLWTLNRAYGNGADDGHDDGGGASCEQQSSGHSDKH